MSIRWCVVALTLLSLCPVLAQAPSRSVTFGRLAQTAAEPENWLTFAGSLTGQNHSSLQQITPANVQHLGLAWSWQARSDEKFEATPLVVDGVLYTVQAPNDVVALDAFTGRALWTYHHDPGAAMVCCGRVNRGVAVLGSTLFMGTLDARLLAIDRDTGKLLWNAVVANPTDPSCAGGICYAITHAPLVIKDKVLVGVAGGDSGPGGIRGFIAAFNTQTGREVWRFYTVPSPSEPGGNTWVADAYKSGGAGVWVTGSYDSESNVTFWGTGNPDGPQTPGDNLYSDSLVALDADSGQLKWHYQFTPHDEMDWDSAHVPVLADVTIDGRTRKLVMVANKNGLLYVLDRTDGKLLLAKPFVEVNWMSGLDERNRPVRIPGRERRGPNQIFPNFGGTNWDPPSFSPVTNLLYVPAWERGARDTRFAGDNFGAIRALDPVTGTLRWEFKRPDSTFHGVLTTASNVVFAGTDAGCRSRMEPERFRRCQTGRGTQSPPDAALLPQGQLLAFNAQSGEPVWETSLGGGVYAAPITYAVGGQQFVAIAAGKTLTVFSLQR